MKKLRALCEKYREQWREKTREREVKASKPPPWVLVLAVLDGQPGSPFQRQSMAMPEPPVGRQMSTRLTPAPQRPEPEPEPLREAEKTTRAPERSTTHRKERNEPRADLYTLPTAKYALEKAPKVTVDPWLHKPPREDMRFLTNYFLASWGENTLDMQHERKELEAFRYRDMWLERTGVSADSSPMPWDEVVEGMGPYKAYMMTSAAKKREEFLVRKKAKRGME